MTSPPHARDGALLEVDRLTAQFASLDGVVHAATNVTFELHAGRVVALLGESGSGKTTVALSILNLLPHPGRIVDGVVRLQGRDLLALPERDMRELRGGEISMIFQDPMSGLNPVLTIGQQIEEIVTSHTNLSKKEARRRAIEVLHDMGFAGPERVAKQYPFHLSGGMAQRVMIGIATALSPKVVIADEPTSALDVTVQAAILDELRRLRDRGTAILLITHDLGVVAQMADEVGVMYGGRIVEYGDVDAIFQQPRHPYTWALMATRPRVDVARDRLPVIPGAPPTLVDQPDECPFLSRCPKALSRCRLEPMPEMEQIEPGHMLACYNPMLAVA